MRELELQEVEQVSGGNHGWTGSTTYDLILAGTWGGISGGFSMLTGIGQPRSIFGGAYKGVESYLIGEFWHRLGF